MKPTLSAHLMAMTATELETLYNESESTRWTGDLKEGMAITQLVRDTLADDGEVDDGTPAGVPFYLLLVQGAVWREVAHRYRYALKAVTTLGIPNPEGGMIPDGWADTATHRIQDKQERDEEDPNR